MDATSWAASAKRSANGIERKKQYASHANPNSPDRRGRSLVVGESLHSHAKHDQVDPERRCGYCRGVVAPKRFWTVSLPRPHPRRGIEIWLRTQKLNFKGQEIRIEKKNCSRHLRDALQYEVVEKK
jgi:hypothetical protein